MIIEVLGYAGAVILVAAFFLASTKRIQGDRYLYHVLNLVGALAVFINAFFRGVNAMAAVEAVWSIIALIGIARVFSAARGKNALE